MPGPTVSVGSWQANSQMARSFAALYFGGMGAKGKNFYSELLCRYGFSADVETIQDLYLRGDVVGAEAAVPEEFLPATALTGTRPTCGTVCAPSSSRE